MSKQIFKSSLEHGQTETSFNWKKETKQNTEATWLGRMGDYRIIFESKCGNMRKTPHTTSLHPYSALLTKCCNYPTNLITSQQKHCSQFQTHLTEQLQVLCFKALRPLCDKMTSKQHRVISNLTLIYKNAVKLFSHVLDWTRSPSLKPKSDLVSAQGCDFQVCIANAEVHAKLPCVLGKADCLQVGY